MIGRKRWAIPGGHIPLHSTGEEPAFVSQDRLCLLNAGDEEASVKVTIFYDDRAPVGPHELSVAAQRVRHIRFNDLIEPEAIPLDVPYAALVESNHPIVVQFTRMDTGSAAAGLMGTMAYGP